MEPKIIEGEHVGVPDGYRGEETAADYISDFQPVGLAGIDTPNPAKSEFHSLEGCVNTSGDFVIPQSYDYVEDFASNGLALVQEPDSPDALMRRGYVDINGNKRIESNFVFADGFKNNGTAKVALPETNSSGYVEVGSYGFIDENGQFLIDPQYDDAKSFFEQETPQIVGSWWALARQGDWYGYLDGEGNRVVTFDSRVKEVSDASERGLPETNVSMYSSNRCNYPDENGLVVVSCGQGAGNFGGWGYADYQGNLVIEPIFETALPFFEGLASVSADGWENQGAIDLSGSYIIQPQFEYLGRFRDGLALAKDADSGRYGFVDKNGVWVVKAEYQNLSLFARDGLASAAGVGLIDKNGMCVFPSEHNYGDYREPNAKNYRFACDLGAIYRLFDSTGNQVSKGEYSDVREWTENGMCAVRTYSQGSEQPLWGFINEDGDMVIEPQFLNVKGFSLAPE